MHSKLFTFVLCLGLLFTVWLVFNYLYKRVKKANTDSKHPKARSKDTSGKESSSSSRNYRESRASLGKKRRKFPFDDEAILWCSEFLSVEEVVLRKLLGDIRACYKQFFLHKRSGGVRIISAPSPALLSIQQAINEKILQSVPIHPAAKGFRKSVSIKDNAFPHLGNKLVFKTDIHDFFGSIGLGAVKNVFFSKLGFSTSRSAVLAHLCCVYRHLPQGAATSPALSNIVVFEMDERLQKFANANNLIYTRYADDLTFSGASIPSNIIRELTSILDKYKFYINKKKTRLITEGRRKIITGISISSGTKLTIPKQKKRELRKNIHFILTRGLGKHKEHIGSTDPAYLKRLIGYLNFWLLVEPDNQYVVDSLKRLKALKS